MNPNTPIEWSQYKAMMFPEGVVPDVLLIPSDLMLLAKVSVVYINSFRISRESSV